MLSISWIIPSDVLGFLSVSNFPNDLDLLDFLDPIVREDYIKCIQQQVQGQKLRGNLCLSSCPGKKVRLTGPIRGRAAINRDLDLDFKRMKSFGITMVVCCLDDKELELLGAPWPDYERTAKTHDFKILRLPMLEGGCPKTLSEVHNVVKKVNVEISQGHHVLAHCRGGVGRAGLFAGCWLLENLLCKSVERTVSLLRERRSAKAIETYAQAEYLIRYAMALNQRLGRSYTPTTQPVSIHELQYEAASGSPSLPFIAKLEHLILMNPTLLQQQHYYPPVPTHTASAPAELYVPR
ncbi:protein-tyrosine phosphatase-like protein [Gilbertella persicaria]|uniref:protein-tyrosine phosphatase-like protein n=1 Tax=Gilbertella persicaria TaxID=101096 RepID=UPI00221FD68D|nr:protein-tyrosine phosphatase-like protein [Gilbertella persicaria]KAI8072129.1 protein-tyrosine phosphatase-like protein [Gilbertella persicaria]